MSGVLGVYTHAAAILRHALIRWPRHVPLLQVLGVVCVAPCSRVSVWVLCCHQAGGYTVGDFVKFGCPLLLLCALVTCTCATLFLWGHDLVAQVFVDDDH